MGETREWLPGQRLADTYVIERRLGVGGMGQVYLARDLTLDRRVAIKRLTPERTNDETSRARFQREATALARCVHPNIVAIHGYAQDAGHWFIVMEHVEGQTLHSALAARGPLPLDEAVTLLEQAAAGLGEAHARGVIHRDIKPSNLVLRRHATGSAHLKVVDFGLARVAAGDTAALTTEGVAMGTPHYMAPEQVRGREVDRRGDIYSLACVLFEMLSGRPPFPYALNSETLAAHLTEPPPSLPDPVGRSWPPGLSRVLERALAKEQDERHQTVEDFARAVVSAAGLLDRQRSEPGVCPSCAVPCARDARFCAQCGTIVPSGSCMACGAHRAGAGHTCASCGLSLLPPTSSARAVPPLQSCTAAVLVCRHGLAADDAGTTSRRLDRLVAIVERQGGRTLSVVGDHLVAIFGADGLSTQELESAVDTGLELRGRVDSPGAATAVGVALGELLTRPGGTFQGTSLALGPVVNNARALAERAAPGEVLVGSAVYREIRVVYRTRPLDDGARAVLSHRPFASGVGELAFDESDAAVGRALELGNLRRVARRVATTGRARVVVLVGPAGTGKTRIARDAMAELVDSSHDWRIEATRCTRTRLPVPYEPFVALLERRLQLPAGSTQVDIDAQLRSLPGISDASVDEDEVRLRVVALGRLTRWRGHSGRAGASDAERQAALSAVASFVEALAASAPLALWIDDLQWSGPATRRLLRAVFDRCAELPLLILLGVRTEAAEELVEALDLPPLTLRLIELTNLDRDDVAELLATQLACAPPSAALVAAVMAFSSGRPLHVIEALQSLEDARARGVDDLAQALSDSLESAVFRRVGRLSGNERATLRALAISDSPVPLGQCAAMLQREVPSSEIDRLLDSGLVIQTRRRRATDPRAFCFRHPAHREIVLRGLAPELVGAQHRRAARWLLDREAAGRVGAKVAEHLHCADSESAPRYLLEAARDAARGYANDEAYEILGALIERYPDSPEGREASLEQISLAIRSGFYREAERAAARAESAEHLDLASRARAACLRGDALDAMDGRKQEALDAFRAAIALGADRDEAAGVTIYAQGRIAMVLLQRGALEAAEAHVRSTLASPLPRTKDSHCLRGLASLYGTLGHVEVMTQRLELAVPDYEAARSFALDAGDEAAAAMARLSLGNAAYAAGDLGEARRIFEDAMGESGRIGFPLGVGLAALNAGDVLVQMRNPDAALQRLEKSQRVLDSIGVRKHQAQTARLVAEALLAQGAFERAQAVALEALSPGQPLDPREHAALSELLARLAGTVSATEETLDDRRDP